MTSVQVTNGNGTTCLSYSICFYLSQAVIHVSTAYANCNQSHIEEAVYPTSIAPEQLLKACEWMDTSMLDLITPGLIRHLPNTYTFTKGLAGAYLNTHAQHLPLGKLLPCSNE